eukprot:COSAG06_NODE_6758_length_2795_cov_1.965875_1_plen_50_part_00
MREGFIPLSFQPLLFSISSIRSAVGFPHSAHAVSARRVFVMVGSLLGGV